MSTLHPKVAAVTDRIARRSEPSRTAYLARIRAAGRKTPSRKDLAASNQAHAFASAQGGDKRSLRVLETPNIGIVTAYNDMLSAHEPFYDYPERIKKAARAAGATAQVAGGVPAMCDGVTQGTAGMELSLWSRDVIALATAVGLSHATFDAAICMGVCDKIVPGLLIGALRFGHLPTIFVPAGPMPSGLPNAEKAKVRVQYAQGKVGSDELLAAEAKSYHSPGTCTFYGTANSNQMMMELMGLHLPGASFVQPRDPLRHALTEAATHQAVRISNLGEDPRPIGELVDERTIVNGIVGLLATGGSTNHTIHLIAVARAAGVIIDWDDMDELSSAVPLLTRLYPNGTADVNHFHEAGGTAFVVGTLLDAGLLHEDIRTVYGDGGMASYRLRPALNDGVVAWPEPAPNSADEDILRPADRPFQEDGGLKLLRGNLGRAVIKTSAVAPERRVVEAPARVFTSQAGLKAAFEAGELDGDVVAVVRDQGPKANGMPELHKLTPPLVALQNDGHAVALITDGRMSGASGKVPSAIHLTPESADGGPIAKVRDGDVIRLDAVAGTVEVKVDESEWNAREPAPVDVSGNEFGTGRELFGLFRRNANSAEEGASALGLEDA